jgi:hypothetical protein
MARLQRLLNVLAWGLAVVIAWTERRDPTRLPGAAGGGTAAGGLDQGTSTEKQAGTTNEPPKPSTETARTEDAETGPTEDASGSGGADVVAESPPPPPPRLFVEVEAAPGETEAPAAAAIDDTPTAAEPLFADATPGAPIVGTAVPIPAPRGGDRPVPAGAVPGDETATCPPEYPIKGNASSMIYHRPGQPSYERTVAEFCFASEADAEGAGYRPPRR